MKKSTFIEALIVTALFIITFSVLKHYTGWPEIKYISIFTLGLFLAALAFILDYIKERRLGKVLKSSNDIVPDPEQWERIDSICWQYKLKKDILLYTLSGYWHIVNTKTGRSYELGVLSSLQELNNELSEVL